MPSCGRSYCDARSLRRHIDNYHVRPLGAAAAFVAGAAFAAGGPAAIVEGTMAMQELSNTAEQIQLNPMSSVPDDDESRQLAHLAAYE